MIRVHRRVHELVVLWYDNVPQPIYNHYSMTMNKPHLLIFQYFVIVEYQIDHQFMIQILIHGNGCVYEFYDERMLFASMMHGHVVTG